MLVDTVEVRKKIEGRIALHEAALAKHRARLAAILALEESDDFETEESDIKPRIPGVSPREPESKRGMSKDILRTVRSANAMTMEALFAAIKERYPETSRQAVATSCRRWEERGYLVVAGDRTTGLSVRMNPAAPKEP